MPGKVNPVVPEAVRMVCAQVIGNEAAVAFAGTQGDFELNVMIPVMAANLLGSIRLLSNASRLLADRCVAGLEANPQVSGGFGVVRRGGRTPKSEVLTATPASLGGHAARPRGSCRWHVATVRERRSGGIRTRYGS